MSRKREAYHWHDRRLQMEFLQKRGKPVNDKTRQETIGHNRRKSSRIAVAGTRRLPTKRKGPFDDEEHQELEEKGRGSMPRSGERRSLISG